MQQGKDAKLKGLAAPSNLSMNQSLEGHNGTSCFEMSRVRLSSSHVVDTLAKFNVLAPPPPPPPPIQITN